MKLKNKTDSYFLPQGLNYFTRLQLNKNNSSFCSTELMKLTSHDEQLLIIFYEGFLSISIKLQWGGSKNTTLSMHCWKCTLVQRIPSLLRPVSLVGCVQRGHVRIVTLFRLSPQAKIRSQLQTRLICYNALFQIVLHPNNDTIIRNISEEYAHRFETVSVK